MKKNLVSASLLETVLFGSSSICPVTGEKKSPESVTSRAGVAQRSDVLAAIEEVRADNTKAFLTIAVEEWAHGNNPKVCCICGKDAEHKLCPSCFQIFGHEMVAKIEAQIAEMKREAKRLPPEVFRKTVVLVKELIVENPQVDDETLAEQISSALNILIGPVHAVISVAHKEIAADEEKAKVFDYALSKVRELFSDTTKVDVGFLRDNPIEHEGSRVGESLYLAAGRQVDKENFARWMKNVPEAARKIVDERFPGYIKIEELIAEAPMWEGRKISEVTLKAAAAQVIIARKREKNQWEADAMELATCHVREMSLAGKFIDHTKVTGLKHNEVEIPVWIVKAACKTVIGERLANQVREKTNMFFGDDSDYRVVRKTGKTARKKAARAGR